MDPAPSARPETAVPPKRHHSSAPARRVATHRVHQQAHQLRQPHRATARPPQPERQKLLQQLRKKPDTRERQTRRSFQPANAKQHQNYHPSAATTSRRHNAHTYRNQRRDPATRVAKAPTETLWLQGAAVRRRHWPWQFRAVAHHPARAPPPRVSPSRARSRPLPTCDYSGKTAHASARYPTTSPRSLRRALRCAARPGTRNQRRGQRPKQYP